MVSDPESNLVAARMLATPKTIIKADSSACSSLKDQIGYTNFQCTKVSPTIPGQRHKHELCLLIDEVSEICLMSDEGASKLNTGWKRAIGKLITADGRWSYLTKVVVSMPVNVHHIIIPMSILQAKSGSEL